MTSDSCIRNLFSGGGCSIAHKVQFEISDNTSIGGARDPTDGGDLTGGWRGPGSLWCVWPRSDRPGRGRDRTGVWGHDTAGGDWLGKGVWIRQAWKGVCNVAVEAGEWGRSSRYVEGGGRGGRRVRGKEEDARGVGGWWLAFIRLSLRRYSKTPPQCICLHARLASRSHCLSHSRVSRLVCPVTSDSSSLPVASHLTILTPPDL